MRRFWFLAIVGGLGCSILLGLGDWQLKRLTWKEAVLEEIATNIAADPVPLVLPVTLEEDRFRAVSAAGAMETGEIHVWTTRKGQGVGYRVIAPFVTATGDRILVDRGFVPSAAKQDERALGQMELVGNLHWPDEVSGFTPDPDREGNVWYARDVATMSEALNTQPVLIVLRESPEGSTDITPMPITTAGIPNDHLQYAITWFSLALIWGGMTAYFLRRAGTQPKGSN